ncbi:unnamed protein product [Lymnaea stagnalis]|uniref:Uncharacterized protein n=1 Tax=Lymnaea stagnalis TaxID=6523 RepID=A0AAV2HDP7_LYMST
MLNDVEKCICKEILVHLNDEDLHSLASTSSNRVVDTYNRKDAEKAILAFTQSIDEFFKRRKISKDVLLKYVFSKGLSVPRNADKDGLVAHIIKSLLTESSQDKGVKSPRENVLDKQSNAASPNRKAVVPSTDCSFPKLDEAFHHQDKKVTPEKVQYVQSVFNYSPTNIIINVNMNHSASASMTHSDQQNAEAFVRWFYEMINSYNPTFSKIVHDFGPQHFWDNAQLFLSMNSRDSKIEDIVCGNCHVANRLLQFCTESHLLFSPNASTEGVKTRSDPHGLKLILVCGTLHKMNSCVGVFQQSFGLVKEPMSPDVWKVKVTCLKMDEDSAMMVPRLTDCEDIQALEGHTIKVLEQSLVHS